jgi:hypothetical protein
MCRPLIPIEYKKLHQHKFEHKSKRSNAIPLGRGVRGCSHAEVWCEIGISTVHGYLLLALRRLTDGWIAGEWIVAGVA